MMLGAAGCQTPGAAEPTKQTPRAATAGSVREAYFLGVSGNSEPPELVDPVSRSEALRQRSYFRAFYDPSGALAALAKFRDGERIFRTEYRYHPNGKIREARVAARDGSIEVRSFDEQGRRVEQP